MKKRAYSIPEILTIIFCVVTGILTIVRCFYSVDMTDESYYYADAINVINGALPFTHNISAQAGMTYPMLPFLAVFRLFSPEWEGVVLYMRLCSAMVRLIAAYVVYRLLMRRFDRLPVLLGMAVLTGWYYFCNDLSYLTIPPWAIMIASLLIYGATQDRQSKLSSKRIAELVIAGVLSAVAVFSNPLAAVCVVLLLIFLPLFSERPKRWVKLIWYCAGGAIYTGLVLIVTAIIGGFKRTLKGIYFLFTMGGRQTEKRSPYIVADFYYSFRWQVLAMAATVLLTAVILKLICKKRNTDKKFIALTSAAAGYFAGLIVTICSTAKTHDLFEVESYMGFAVMCLVIYFLIKERHDTFLWIFSQPMAIFVFTYMTFAPEPGALSHMAFFAPAVVPVVIIFFSEAGGLPKALMGITTLLFAAWISICDWQYVYRDAPMKELDTRVDEGVYKGLMTTDERAVCLPEMERWIKANTDDVEMVSFRDCVPFANLMYRKIPCDIRAWDEFEYDSYMYNNGESTFVYYAHTGRIPDRYIYIDYGRNEKLSVEDDGWKFNKWVYTYYYPLKEEKVNDMFRVVVYQYNGSFNGDFESWREFAK